MTTPAPGETSGPRAVSAPQGRMAHPGRGLAVAGVAYVAAVTVTLGYPSWRESLTSTPSWLLALLDLVVLLPLAAGVAAAAAFGVRAAARRVGLLDVVIGIATGLGIRAVVEAISPTTGSLLGPLQTGEPLEPDTVAALAIAIVSWIAISPVIEELFFRGLAQRVLQTLFSIGDGRAARIAAATVAIGVSTAAFVALHGAAYGGRMPLGEIAATALTGLGCGILVATTGRLGAAICAHVVFNALGVVLLVL